MGGKCVGGELSRDAVAAQSLILTRTLSFHWDPALLNPWGLHLQALGALVSSQGLWAGPRNERDRTGGEGCSGQAKCVLRVY